MESDVRIVEFKRMVDPVSFTPLLRVTFDFGLRVTVDENITQESDEMLGRMIRTAVELFLKESNNAAK